ncbi:hypothetical protein [Corallococcus macrosporus]|uniref:Uncharacterized protein n=2 Tax=Myxococcaceae TaxID=31 RepID=A0A250K2X6_9BACT|nr:hypothetical protein [Corallococcus macrosporus]AEI64913.1 hypothetical protein LILAB_15040 [Corallococcus macrosporus]ATB50363.1 hypothetical protein MYMAC_006018 [Corallococcus macrosporus DSM 14697]
MAAAQMGTETNAEYMMSITDTDPAVYRLFKERLLGATPVKAMDFDELKRKAFKARVGFDRIPTVEDADVGVVADWGGIQELLPSSETGWEPGADSIMPLNPGMVLRKWSFRRGSGALTVKVFVFSTGPVGARGQLVAEATTMSSLPVSPYVRGPAYLGQFSIKTPEEPMTRLVWVFHNVCVTIGEDDTGLSVESLARSIQGFMERHVTQRVSLHLPVLDKVTVSSCPVQVGQEVQVEAHLKAEGAQAWWRIDFTAPADALEFVRQGPTSSGFRARRAGMVSVDVDVTDGSTLLRSRIQAQVAIQPAR